MAHKLIIKNFPADYDSQKIKALRLFTKMSLSESLRLYRFLGGRVKVTLISGVSRDVADHYFAIFDCAGFSALVEECEDDTPMRVDSSANKKYEWTPFRVIREVG